MAKNVSLMGADYPDVPAVELPETGGGTASFFEISDTTATFADVFPGKYVYIADGTRGVGTLENKTIGFAYYTCSTAAATTSKEVIADSGFHFRDGGLVAVKFDNNVPADSELAVHDPEYYPAYKDIMHQGAKIKDGVINAGDTALFMYTLPYWYLIAVDRSSAVKKALLWTNPSSTSDFAAQTLPIDISNYSAVKISFKDHKNANPGVVVECMKGGNALSIQNSGVDSGARWRYFAPKADGTGITFSDGYNGSTPNNAYGVPYQIWGLND